MGELLRQVIRFILVGTLNTLVGYSLYAVFLFVGMNYRCALLLATILGVFFNFKTIGQFVFNNTNKRLFFKFVVVYVFIYCFQSYAIQLMELEMANLYLAGFISMIPAAIVTFVLNKLIVFRKNYETS